MGHLGSNLRLDLRVALRRIRATPGISALIVLLLAAGLALNSTVFALVHALVLRPLPVSDPGSLYLPVQDVPRLGARSEQPYAVVSALQTSARSFREVAAYAEYDTACRTPAGPMRVRAHIVTGAFFETLGTRPLLGRVLDRRDAAPGAGAIPVVLSYPFWRRAFGADPGVAGRPLTVNQRVFTIAGVLREHDNGILVETVPDLFFPLPAAAALAVEPEFADYRKLDFIPFVRLKPGVSAEAARAEVAAIQDAVLSEEARRTGERAYWRDRPLRLEPLLHGKSLLRPKLQNGLWLLMGGVAALLLIICANAGGLLMAAGYARRGEMAVRRALGATGGRIVTQMLTENLLLTGASCVLGLALALAATPMLAGALPPLRDLTASTLTLSLDLRPSWPVLVVSMLLCLGAALAAALPVSLQSASGDLHGALRSARVTHRQRLRWALVVVQAGLCTLLLGGAGLLTTTLENLRSLRPGFDAERVVTFTLDPSVAGYTGEQSAVLRRRLLEEVRRIPGVLHAGFASRGLMRGTGLKTTVSPAGGRAPRSEFLNTSLNSISEGYFDALGIRLVAGRDYRPSDLGVRNPTPAVVNQAFARRFFPGESPLGKLFGTGVDVVAKPDRVIIGVVSDAKYRSLREPVPPTVYDFAPVALKTGGSFVLHVRTRGRPEELVEPVRRALAGLEPGLPFYEIHTLQEEVDDSLWAERVLAWLSSCFGGAAVVLVLMGIYATLAFAVAQARREVGIRIALGAQASDILGILSTRPLLLVASGVSAGAVAFFMAAPLFRTVLYEVPAMNPPSLAAAVALVLAVSALATWAAVRSALRMSPASVLREE